MKKTHVLVVENDRFAKEMFSTYIESAKDRYVLIAAIDDAANAELICLRNRIDLILMDVCTANDESGIDAAKVIKRKYPSTKIIIITGAPEESFLKKAKDARADSFYYKNTSEEKFVDVMDRTMNGEHIWPEDVPDIQIGMCSSKEFTKTEIRVMRYLVEGYSIAETSKLMGVKYCTTRYHVDNIKDKIGVNTITGIVRIATRQRFILPEFK